MKIFFGSGKGLPSAAERQTAQLQTQAARATHELAETSAAHGRTSGAARLASSSGNSLPSTDTFRSQSAAISPEDQNLADRFVRGEQSQDTLEQAWQRATTQSSLSNAVSRLNMLRGHLTSQNVPTQSEDKDKALTDLDDFLKQAFDAKKAQIPRVIRNRRTKTTTIVLPADKKG